MIRGSYSKVSSCLWVDLCELVQKSRILNMGLQSGRKHLSKMLHPHIPRHRLSPIFGWGWVEEGAEVRFVAILEQRGSFV